MIRIEIDRDSEEVKLLLPGLSEGSEGANSSPQMVLTVGPEQLMSDVEQQLRPYLDRVQSLPNSVHLFGEFQFDGIDFPWVVIIARNGMITRIIANGDGGNLPESKLLEALEFRLNSPVRVSRLRRFLSNVATMGNVLLGEYIRGRMTVRVRKLLHENALILAASWSDGSRS